MPRKRKKKDPEDLLGEFTDRLMDHPSVQTVFDSATAFFDDM